MALSACFGIIFVCCFLCGNLKNVREFCCSVCVWSTVFLCLLDFFSRYSIHVLTVFYIIIMSFHDMDSFSIDTHQLKFPFDFDMIFSILYIYRTWYLFFEHPLYRKPIFPSPFHFPFTFSITLHTERFSSQFLYRERVYQSPVRRPWHEHYSILLFCYSFCISSGFQAEIPSISGLDIGV